jgi:hypothetical protein
MSGMPPWKPISQEEADRRHAEILAEDWVDPPTDEDYEDDSAIVIFFRPLPDEEDRP